jgi:hypothetical protein
LKIVRPPDGSLIVRVRPGVFPEGLLALVIPLPLWKLLAEGPYPLDELPLLMLASVIAAACIAIFAEVSDFTFDPLSSELRWSRKTCFSRQAGCVPLRDIRAVQLISDFSSKGHLLHQAVLLLPERPLPLTRYRSTGRSSERAAQAIHDFLAARGLPKAQPEPVKRTAVAFHLEVDGRWAAQLDCGHRVYPRHEPPWVDLLTEAGRKAALGMTAACDQCQAGAPKDSPP